MQGSAMNFLGLVWCGSPEGSGSSFGTGAGRAAPNAHRRRGHFGRRCEQLEPFSLHEGEARKSSSTVALALAPD